MAACYQEKRYTNVMQLLYACVCVCFPLIRCLVLEGKILLVSSRLQSLITIAEVLVSLLYPLHWHHVYAPIMPPNQHDLLDAPVPFIMGLNCPPENATREELDIQDEVS